MTTSKFQEALENFITSAGFLPACINSTKAAFSGSDYVVELFEDGEFRVLWSNQVGNLYQSPGVILSAPQFSDEDWKDFEECGEDPYDFDGGLEKDMRDSLTIYELDQTALANVEY